MAVISEMTTEQRLEKLEKELSRVKRRNHLLLAVVVLAVVLMSARISMREKTIKANAFVLVDENGKTRALLNMVKDWPSLGLSYKNGNVGVALSMVEDGPILGLSDKNGNPRASLFVVEDGPVLALYGENGKTRAGLAVLKDGPLLRLLDENEKPRATLGISQTTTPDGKVISYPESSLLLYKPDGTVLWQAPP